MNTQRFELSHLAEHVRKSFDWDDDTKRSFVSYLRENGMIHQEEGKQYVETGKKLAETIAEFRSQIENSE